MDKQEEKVMESSNDLVSSQKKEKEVESMKKRPLHYHQYPYLKKEKNTAGMLGLIFSILAIILFWLPILGRLMWLAGLVLSIVGMSYKPKGMAIAGLVISLSFIVILVLIMLFLGVGIGVFSTFPSFPEGLQDLLNRYRY